MVTKNIEIDYGAIPDGKYATPFITTVAGSNTVIADSSIWSTGDVGKNVFIGGTNIGTNDFLVTISSVNPSGLSIGLSTNVTVTLTSCQHVCVWGTDNLTAWQNFTSSNQGATVTLNIPSTGVYYISNAGILYDGISDLTTIGVGGTLACAIVQFGSAGQFQFGNSSHSARTENALAGATSVTLKSCLDLTIFSTGQFACMTGVDTQALGFPTGPYYFDYVFVNSIDSSSSSPTYKRISFASSTPLRYDYLDSWPLYSSGNAFSPDYGGPATLYNWAPSWNARFSHNNLSIVMDGQIGATGKYVEWVNCNFPIAIRDLNDGPFCTMIQEYHITNCNVAATIELDKIVDAAYITGGTIFGLVQQTASFHSITYDGVTITGGILGSPKTFTATNCNIAALTLGPPVSGINTTTTLTNCNIATFDGTVGVNTYPGGILDVGDTSSSGNPLGYVASGITMSSGVLSVPKSYHSGIGCVYWAMPNANSFWSDENGFIETRFKVLGLTGDSSFTYIQTNLTGGFLTPPLGATKIYVHGHIAPSITVSNCTGDYRIVGMNNAPAGEPIFSNYSATYTSGVCTGSAQPRLLMWGNLVRLSINVTHPYTHGPLTFSLTSWPVLKSDNSAVNYVATVDCTVPGERVITLSGVTGSGGVDSGLAVPDSIQTWFTGGNNGTGPLFSTDVSATDPNVTVIINMQTDQGFGESPSDGNIVGVRSMGATYGIYRSRPMRIPQV